MIAARISPLANSRAEVSVGPVRQACLAARNTRTARRDGPDILHTVRVQVLLESGSQSGQRRSIWLFLAAPAGQGWRVEEYCDRSWTGLLCPSAGPYGLQYTSGRAQRRLRWLRTPREPWSRPRRKG